LGSQSPLSGPLYTVLKAGNTKPLEKYLSGVILWNGLLHSTS